jgi:hypothetical protein
MISPMQATMAHVSDPCRRSTVRARVSVVLLAMCGLIGCGDSVHADAHGRVTCEILENGHGASGVVAILKDEKEVASSSCGRELTVPAGDYVAALRLDGALDGPEQRQPISVKAGAAQKLHADFPTATLEVRIAASSGRRAAGIAIIKRGGQQLGTLGSGVAAHLSTGTYHILVRYRAQEKDLGDVVLAAGQQRALDAVFE